MNIILPVLVGLLVATAARSQERERERGPLPLQEGDPIPEVSGFTAEGDPFPLSQLKGSYSVMAFGCLT